MAKDTMTITRKIELIPVYDAKFHKKWFDPFVNRYYNEKIEWKKNCIKKNMKKAEKEKINIEIKHLEDTLNNYLENGTITNKMIQNYGYDLVRRSMKSEALRKNYIMSYMFSTLRNINNFWELDSKERTQIFNENWKYCFRKEGSNADGGSLLDGSGIENPLGGYGFGFNQSLRSKLSDLVFKQGLLDGRCSLPTYKEDSPFSIEKSYIKLVHEYKDMDELYANIHKKEPEIYLNMGTNGNPTIARFRINTGDEGNKEELLTTLLRIYEGEYTLCGSSIQISKNKIIMNMSITIPKCKKDLDENVVVGVDLGIAIPAVCALNTSDEKEKFIGDVNDFLRVRTQINNQRERLQKSLTFTSGGHGRKKKLKALEKVSGKERNFVKTYNHIVSKQIVDFAVDNKAKYINMEDLTGFKGKGRILRYWSYYELQSLIEYKAEKYGIVVRKVDPAYTSQTCSCCGSLEEGQRVSQSEFVCKNPECKKYGEKVNADFNAARNIAMSTNFNKK